MIATRIRKNTAPTDAPPPIRRAMRHSRKKRARAAVICGPSSGGPHPAALRASTFSREREKGSAPSPACGRGLGGGPAMKRLLIALVAFLALALVAGVATTIAWPRYVAGLG